MNGSDHKLMDEETNIEAMRQIAHLVQEKEHRERQIEAIRKTSDALFSHPSVDSMVRATLQIALEVLRADAGTVYIYDERSDSLVFRYVIGPAAEQLMGKSFPASQGIAGTVFRTSQPELTGNVTVRDDFNPDMDKETGYLTESMMTVPVKRSDGDPIGVMQVLNAQSPPFDSRDLEVLEVLCAQAATGIEHAKLVEEARKAQIVHVIGDISHDVKNFMTPISSGVMTFQPMVKELFEDLDKIRARCDGPEVEALAKDIERATQSVRGVYDWMLESFVSASDKAQARAKEIADAVKGEIAPPFFEEADINLTVRDVMATLRAVANKGGVRFVEELDTALPLVQFDKKQMFNALYNLVNNAIPFTPSGGSITVRTRPFPSSHNPTQLEIMVSDTGKGMPEHVRERLFTDKAISTSKHGTGLGTRIVGGVVKRHNGTITVESEEGEGSTFTVQMPLRHEEA